MSALREQAPDKSRVEQSTNRIRVDRCQRSLLQCFASCLVEGFHGSFTLTANVKDGIITDHEKTVRKREID